MQSSRTYVPEVCVGLELELAVVVLPFAKHGRQMILEQSRAAEHSGDGKANTDEAQQLPLFPQLKD